MIQCLDVMSRYVKRANTRQAPVLLYSWIVLALCEDEQLYSWIVLDLCEDEQSYSWIVLDLCEDEQFYSWIVLARSL